MTNAELLNTNSRDQKKFKKQTKRTNAIEISENTQEKIEYLQNLCGNSGKHKTLRCKTGMLTFILI